MSSQWNNIKEGIYEDAGSFKNALLNIFRGTSAPGNITINKPINSQPAASSIFSGSIQEIRETGSDLTREARDKLHRSIADTKQTVNDLSKEGSDKSQSIFNWGKSRAERAKVIAIGNFDKANKKYQDVLTKYNESKKGFLFPKADPELEKLLDEAKKQLNESRERLISASSEFEQVAKQNISDLSDKLAKDDENLTSKGFFNWFKSQTFGLEGKEDTNPDVRLAETTVKSVEGWGDTVAQFSREKLEEEKENATTGISSRI